MFDTQKSRELDYNPKSSVLTGVFLCLTWYNEDNFRILKIDVKKFFERKW